MVMTPVLPVMGKGPLFVLVQRCQGIVKALSEWGLLCWARPGVADGEGYRGNPAWSLFEGETKHPSHLSAEPVANLSMAGCDPKKKNKNTSKKLFAVTLLGALNSFGWTTGK